MDYTHCTKYTVHHKDSKEECATYLEEHGANATCKCEREFKLKDDIEKQVYLYYGLSNFYQVIQTDIELKILYTKYHYWICRKNSLELIELSSINKVSLVFLLQ